MSAKVPINTEPPAEFLLDPAGMVCHAPDQWPKRREGFRRNIEAYVPIAVYPS
jgi:hypothetical protein